MLMIRLQRVGRKHEPVFRLVLTDSKNSAKSGRFLEVLGNYDARRGEQAEFKIDRIKHWLIHGAKLSDTVHNILIEKKVIEGKKINVLSRKRPPITDKETVAAEQSEPVKKVEPELESQSETVEKTIEETPGDKTGGDTEEEVKGTKQTETEV